MQEVYLKNTVKSNSMYLSCKLVTKYISSFREVKLEGSHSKEFTEVLEDMENTDIITFNKSQ